MRTIRVHRAALSSVMRQNQGTERRHTSRCKATRAFSGIHRRQSFDLLQPQRSLGG